MKYGCIDCITNNNDDEITVRKKDLVEVLEILSRYCNFENSKLGEAHILLKFVGNYLGDLVKETLSEGE